MDGPDLYRDFIESALAALQGDDRILGVAAAGSWLRGEMDAWSDLDLVMLCASEHFKAVIEDRGEIAASLGDLVSWFPGDHVGEPERLIICMYGPSLTHVDLKFVTAAQLATDRVEDPEILWERDGAMSQALSVGAPAWPEPDWQWIEDRFWTWVHYLSCKLGRGELLEVVSGLDFLRVRVFGATAVTAAGYPAQGVRRFETRCPELVPMMTATMPTYDVSSCAAGIEAAVALYRHLRERIAPEDLVLRDRAEREAVAFLSTTVSGINQNRA